MSRLACQTLRASAPAPRSTSAASATVSGFGTLCGSFGARSTRQRRARRRACAARESARSRAPPTGRARSSVRSRLAPRDAPDRRGNRPGCRPPKVSARLRQSRRDARSGNRERRRDRGHRRRWCAAEARRSPASQASHSPIAARKILGRRKARQRQRLGKSGKWRCPVAVARRRVYPRGFSHCAIVMPTTRARKLSSSVPSPG